MTALEKYHARLAATHALLCVGLDSDLNRLPAQFQNEALPQFAFNRWIIEQTHPYVCAYKLNMAFYEAQGVAGWQALHATVEYLCQNHPEIVTICDAKRGDIGSTSAAYAQAIFDHLGFDAVTLNPYLGQEALQPFLSRADKICIILCRTSNPSAGELQDLLVGDKPLWQVVAQKVAEEWNSQGNCMLVMGATYPEEIGQARALVGDMPFLVPGIGTQGGDLEAVIQQGTTGEGGGLLITSSRAIIFDPNPHTAAEQLHHQMLELLVAG